MVVLQLNPNIFRKQLATQPLTGNSELSKLHARNLVLNVLDLQLDWISGPVVVRLRLCYWLKEQDLEVWVAMREEAYLDSNKLEIYDIGIFRNNFDYNVIIQLGIFYIDKKNAVPQVPVVLDIFDDLKDHLLTNMSII